jgi:hypothetical protein
MTSRRSVDPARSLDHRTPIANSFAGTFAPDREHVRDGHPRAEGVGLVDLSPHGLVIQARFYASSNPLLVSGGAAAVFLLCVPVMMAVRHTEIVVWPMLAVVAAGALYSMAIDRIGRAIQWVVPWERVEILAGPGEQFVIRVRRRIVVEGGLPEYVWFRPVAGKERLRAALDTMRKGRT